MLIKPAAPYGELEKDRNPGAVPHGADAIISRMIPLITGPLKTLPIQLVAGVLVAIEVQSGAVRLLLTWTL